LASRIGGVLHDYPMDGNVLRTRVIGQGVTNHRPGTRGLVPDGNPIPPQPDVNFAAVGNCRPFMVT
jgi:hypothetical protein